MDFKSRLLNDAVEQMSSLPGVGKRSALRLVLYLLDQSEKEVKDFTQAFLSLKEHLNFCSKCYHITEQKMCEICINPSRSEDLICVVQDIRDLLAIESTQQFYGKYHVLGGVISPMDGIGPNDLKINELKERIVKENTKEIILALPATMEGDTTNFYLYRKLQKRKSSVKAALMDQSLVAGLGNIYVLEALWLTKISPLRKANNVSKSEVEALTNSIRRVLTLAIKAGGTSLQDFRQVGGEIGYFQQSLNVYGCFDCPWTYLLAIYCL